MCKIVCKIHINENKGIKIGIFIYELKIIICILKGMELIDLYKLIYWFLLNKSINTN